MGETAAAATTKRKPESDLLVKADFSGLLSIQELSPKGEGRRGGGAEDGQKENKEEREEGRGEEIGELRSHPPGRLRARWEEASVLY